MRVLSPGKELPICGESTTMIISKHERNDGAILQFGNNLWLGMFVGIYVTHQYD
jgi:hypothetical protein